MKNLLQYKRPHNIYKKKVSLFSCLDIKDVDFESKNKWIKDIGPKFQYSYLRKLCVVIYTLSGIIFSPEYKGLGGFLNMLKTSRLSNNPGLFYYICSRFSILTHPYNINACDLFQLQSKFPQEIIQNLKSQIIILDLTIFDEINTKFVDLLTEFLTCPLNIPYFTLITTIKYKLSSNPLHEDYYSEAEVEDIQNLSEEQKKTCKDLLKKIISRLIIENRIFLISKLEGNVVGETMQEGIFFLKDFLLPDLEVYRPEELNKILKNTVSQAIKAFFMVILGHEIAHETRFEIAPKKSILFTTPKKDIFSTNDPKKPFEIGAGWEIYLAKKRIHLSDFLKNDDLVKLFLIPKFWEKKTMEDVFEKHFDNKLHMAQTPKGTNWQEEEDEPGYRCCICSVFCFKIQKF